MSNLKGTEFLWCEGSVDSFLGRDYVFGSGQEGEVLDGGGGGCVIRLKECFCCEGVAEAADDLLGYEVG